MEQARLLIALALSFVVILVWQFFFVDREVKKAPAPTTAQEQLAESDQSPATSPQPVGSATSDTATGSEVLAATTGTAETITVDTPLYRVAINGQGAAFTSYVLKKYRETVEKDAPLKELIRQKPGLSSVTNSFAGNSVEGLDKAIFTTNIDSQALQVSDSPPGIDIFPYRHQRGNN